MKLENLGLYNKKYSSKDWDYIVNRYKQGDSMPLLAAEYGVDKHTVGYHIKKRGIVASSLSHYGRECKLNEACFDELTPEALYWLGFLFADGSLHMRKTPELSMRLSVVDISHIEKFKRFIGSTHKIHVSKTPNKQFAGSNLTASISVSGKKLAARLIELGFGKKCDRFPTGELSQSRDFWRGVIDGDGTMSIKPKPIIDLKRFPGKRSKPYNLIRMNLVGWFDMISRFQAYVKSITVTEAKIQEKGSIFKLALSSNPAADIIRELYLDACVSLNRKQIIADRIISEKATR